MPQVSRYWRSVFTSYPWVWTDVTVKTATPLCRVTTALKNSRRLSLRLDLQIHLGEKDTAHHPHYMASTHGLFRFANFRPHPEPFTILSLLEPYHGHIQRFRIRFLYHDNTYGHDNTYDHAVTQLIQHPLFQCSFDVLDSLSLSVADVCHTWYRPYVFPALSAKVRGNFPRLRSLRLSVSDRSFNRSPDAQCLSPSPSTSRIVMRILHNIVGPGVGFPEAALHPDLRHNTGIDGRSVCGVLPGEVDHSFRRPVRHIP